MPEKEPNPLSRFISGKPASRLPGSRHSRSRVRWMKIGIAASLLSVLVISCGTPTFPCGTFNFTGAKTSNSGVRVTVDFNFNPAACGARCNCNTICYVQIVRIIDLDTGAFIAPNTDQQNRIVTGLTPTQNGWAVDRISGSNWGYYGRNNDGTFAGRITTGSNTTTATLRDTAAGWPNNTWFDAVSVPVCIDSGSGCVNRLLGYYYWLFAVNNTGNADDPFNEIGVTWMQDSFNSAVTEWNNDAPGLGKNAFPAMSPLP